MTQPGLLSDSDVLNYLYVSKMTTGLVSKDGESDTNEYDFQVYCESGVPTTLITLRYSGTMPYPQRHLIDLHFKVSANDGTANSPVRFVTATTRTGVSTTGAPSNSAFVITKNIGFGAPAINLTVNNITTVVDPNFVYLPLQITLANVSAWVSGTVKTISVYST